MLDASASYGAYPIPLRKRAPQHHLDGIDNCVDGDISAASLLPGGEVRLGDPIVERRRIDVLHDQICAAGPIVEDFVHFGYAEGQSRGLSLGIEVHLGTRLGLQARVSTLDKYLGAKGGGDYIAPGALGAEVDDVSLSRRKLHNIRQCRNDTT